MGGGAMQLAFFGAQDVVLTGSAQVTYFKLIYRRCTPFAICSELQNFQGPAGFGRKVVCPISRQGDIVGSVWLQVILPDLAQFTYDTPQTAAESVPAILSARWMSKTTAQVTLIPSTDGLDVSYTVVATPNTGSAVTVNGTGTTLTLTGLSTAKTYTVAAKRVDASDESGSFSETMPIVAIKWTNSIGHAILSAVELQIGGSRISRMQSGYMDILSELTMKEEKRAGFESMIGKYANWDLYENSFGGAKTMYIPLQFAFNKNVGLGIPLIALQYMDTTLNFEFRDYTECIKSNVAISQLVNARGLPPAMDVQTYATFYYLDVNERRTFASTPHEFLIEDVQYLGDTPIIFDSEDPNLGRKIATNFSHPVKELIFVYNAAAAYNAAIAESQYSVRGNEYFNYNLPTPYADIDPIKSAKIQLNGQDRFSERPGSYFRLVQPYSHHTRIPAKKVYSYSYALNPEEIQPSGSCNYSRVSTSHLVVNFADECANTANVSCNGRIQIYATSYNILRIAQGQGGLAFSGA